MDRRTLIKGMASLPLAAVSGLPLSAFAAAQTSAKPRYLILVELNGGNDGLNMVVPYSAAEYAQLRPQLGLKRDQVLQLDQRIGLNPVMDALMPVFKDGHLAVVQGVGYPDPNRSHFRSIAIWDTASGSQLVENQGWLTRIGSAEALGRDYGADAVVIGRNPAPVSGGKLNPIVMANIRSFQSQAKRVGVQEANSANPALEHVLAIQSELHQAGDALTANRPQAPGDFPKTPFGRDLGQAVQLLAGDPATPIVKVALSSFDTHANQRANHDRLLGQLAEGLSSLRGSLQQAGIWDQTLVMTYSEFGRRARENSSHGTDHGTAAPHFVMGGAVKGGIYGGYPDLAQLDNDDLVMSVDYRSLYNTVFAKWWSLPDAQIDPGQYKAMDLLRT